MNIKDEIQPFLDKIKAGLETAYATNYPQILNAGVSYVTNAKDRLTTAAEARMNGQLTAQELMDLLGEEKNIFMSELESFEVLGAGIAQEEINNAQQIVIDAVTDLISKSGISNTATEKEAGNTTESGSTGYGSTGSTSGESGATGYIGATGPQPPTSGDRPI